MPLKYHLILHPDLSKNAVTGKNRVHEQVRSIIDSKVLNICTFLDSTFNKN